MFNEQLKLSGELSIVLKDKDGNVKDQRELKNLVVDSGLAFIISRMVGTAKAVMSHMALGSSTTATASGQTDLVSMLGAREAIDSTTINGSVNQKVTYVSNFEAGDATGAVTEAGIFNAATGGDMLCRTTFPVVNKQADDTLAITWTVTLAAA
ncbi:hypothetical protein [Flavobacterium sp.]|jgi:hypothetical protein|uniref:hypothetical protein n=1 Tax=Flavobacterium sp. TaxID=239 RepID=UPI0037BF4207